MGTIEHNFFVPNTRAPAPITEQQRAGYFDRIKKLLREKNAVLIAHFYVDAAIQRLADETGGIVSDSLQMARFGREHAADTLVVAGVKFMAETAKMLSPEKRVLMPTTQATCSMDLGCPATEFKAFCEKHSDRTVVVYANTSAAVKACADWVVTSSNALEIIDFLDAKGEKILWAPDKYLGHYIKKQTGADIIMWNGSCVVHEEFKAAALRELKKQYPDAGILVHPESPADVIAMADEVGSTSKLLHASQELPHKRFIVATDRGIFYKMQQVSPNKEFISAPTGGHGGACKSCGHCPWMAMNNLERLEKCLEDQKDEILISHKIIERAKLPLERMVNFKES